MTSHGQCPRGGACECPRVGAFFKLMTSRGKCPRGGAPGVPPIQVETPPPPTWLAGYGPAHACRAMGRNYVPVLSRERMPFVPHSERQK